MAKKQNDKLDQALDRLADLMPYGHAQASMDPAGFLDDVCDLIKNLRAAEKEITRLQKIRWRQQQKIKELKKKGK